MFSLGFGHRVTISIFEKAFSVIYITLAIKTNMYSFIRERFGMLIKTFLVLFHNCTVCVCVCVCLNYSALTGVE